MKEKIEFHYIMSGLVKNVYDFVDTDDLKISKKYVLKKYNERLTEIYLMEEKITNMPIGMEKFELFTEKNPSSILLNIAYKAVQIIDAEKSENFLYNLRYATIVDTHQTIKFEEILKVVRKTGIDEEKFIEKFRDGSAEKSLKNDLEICQKLNIHSLPSYLIAYEDKKILIQELLGYEYFVEIIKKIE